MMVILIMVVKDLQTDSGKKIKLTFYFNLNYFSVIRLLASSKIEITNEMTLKTGNTAMVVKLIESE
jgi:hypothetical protein